MAALIVAARRRARELESEVRAGEALKVYGQSLVEPILGRDLMLPAQEEIQPNQTLDESMLYVRWSGGPTGQCHAESACSMCPVGFRCRSIRI